MNNSAALVLMTDFGLRDGAVAAMKGVARGVNTDLSVVDLTHEVPAFNILEGGYRLRQTAPYWSAGTVFVIVVDPGVGTNRKSVAAKDAGGRIYVCPDNGLLTLIEDDLGPLEAFEIDEIMHRLPGSSESYTFLGRDLYAFVGAKLASGLLEFGKIGETLPKITRLEIEAPTRIENAVRGVIPVLDIQFGNVWTNIPKHLLDELGVKLGDQLEVRVFKHHQQVYQEILPYVPSFGHVKLGERLVYVNSLLNASLGMNCSSFAGHYGVSSGEGWGVELRTVKD
jgi:S-adenosylmethionine hydrolase